MFGRHGVLSVIFLQSGAFPWLWVFAVCFIAANAILSVQYNKYARKNGLDVLDAGYFDRGKNSKEFVKLMLLIIEPPMTPGLAVCIWANRIFFLLSTISFICLCFGMW